MRNKTATMDAIDRIYARADRDRLQQREALQTEGPWIVLGKINASGDLGVGREDETLAPVAVIRIQPRKGSTRANAALVSAAPDFSKAAKITIERLADLPRFLQNNGSAVLGGIVQECLETLRAALQKSAGAA